MKQNNCQSNIEDKNVQPHSKPAITYVTAFWIEKRKLSSRQKGGEIK